MQFGNPSREQFKALYLLDDDEPVLMLNLLRFHDIAQYELNDPHRPSLPITGRDAFASYSAAAMEVFIKYGGKQVWIGQALTTLIGPASDKWSVAFLAYYPSVVKFIEMVKSPEYQSATRHRTAAVADARLIVCEQLEAGLSFAPLAYLDDLKSFEVAPD